MPESWLKNATRKASMIGTRSRHVQNAVDATRSDEAARIASASDSTWTRVACGSISLRTLTPVARSPFRPISHRGLSGMPRHIRVYAADGNAATPSIQRQAFSPMPASSAFDANATRIPNTMLNWNMPASRPRYAGGAISEMYSGAATVEMPIPIPPITRATVNIAMPFANAHPSAEMM